MAMRRMKKETKKLARPTDAFKKSAKKPEPDDEPARMRGGKGRRKRLAGMMI